MHCVAVSKYMGKRSIGLFLIIPNNTLHVRERERSVLFPLACAPLRLTLKYIEQFFFLSQLITLSIYV